VGKIIKRFFILLMTVSVMYSAVVYIVHYVEKQNLKDFQMDSLVIDNHTDTLTTQLDGSNPLQIKWKYPEGKGIYFPFLSLMVYPPLR
jgi:hypothetical protein